MIVKVQIPLYTTEKQPQALVTDETREINFRVPVTVDLRARMGTLTKRYFQATVEGHQLVLGDVAPAQEW